MKKALSIAIAVAFMTSLVGVASATSTTTTTPPATEKKTEKTTDKAETKTDKTADKTTKKVPTKSVSGAVKTAAADSIVVAGKEKGKDKEWTFAVDANTKLKKAGKDLTAADLKAGDQVQVRYSEADGKQMATWVTVKTGATAAKSANPCAAKMDKKTTNPCAAKTEKKQ